MPSLFQELMILDRPYVPMTLNIGGRGIEVEVRLPSAQEQDAIDAFYMDFYAKTIAEKLEVKEGYKTSERDSMRLIYENRPKTDLIDQLLPTRMNDIAQRSFEIAGIDRQAEYEKVFRMQRDDPDAATEYAKALDEALTEARIQSRNEFYDSYDKKSIEELAQIMADVNINTKATTLASQARESDVIYYSVYDKKTKQRLFESPEEVLRELRPDKISEWTKNIRKAIQDHEDIPFVSPDDKELNGQPSSSSVSAAATKTGGKRTKTMRGN